MSSNAKNGSIDINSEHAIDYSVPELVNFLKSTYRSSDYKRVTQLLVAKKEKMNHEALKDAMGELGRVQASHAEMAAAKLMAEDALVEKSRECDELRRVNLRLEDEKRRMSKVKNEVGAIEGRNVETIVSKHREELIACRNACYELKEKVLRLEEEKKLIGEEKKVLMDREARGEERCRKIVEDGKSEKEVHRVKIGELGRKIMEVERQKRDAVALVELYKRRDSEMGARITQLENDVAILLIQHPSLLANEVDVGDTITEGGLPSAGAVEITDRDDVEIGDNTLASGLKRKRVSPISGCDTDASRHGSQTGGMHGDVCSTVPTPSTVNTSEVLKPRTEQLRSEEKAGRYTSGDFLSKLAPDISSDSSDSEDDWKNEKTMQAEFEIDPELCMRAVCALYKEKCFETKTDDDALRGTKLAEFLTNKHPRYALKRSFTELLKHDAKGLDDCRTLAMKYSHKLFEIYMKCGDSRFMIE